jgi:hypothetical protein
MKPRAAKFISNIAVVPGNTLPGSLSAGVTGKADSTGKLMNKSKATSIKKVLYPVYVELFLIGSKTGISYGSSKVLYIYSLHIIAGKSEYVKTLKK